MFELLEYRDRVESDEEPVLDDAIGGTERAVVLFRVPDAQRQSVAPGPDPMRKVDFVAGHGEGDAETREPLAVVPVVPLKEYMIALHFRCNLPLVLIKRGSGDFSCPRGLHIA